jgi:nicotinate-nucleotide pyrophosphorylase (carboxylating)
MNMDSAVVEIVRRALEEDIGTGDVTSVPIIPTAAHLYGIFLAKESGVLAGIDVVREVFRQVDSTIVFTETLEDGTAFESGDILATVSGYGPGILVGERVALNFLQRMSGVATMTRRYVAATRGTRARILDTRKTMPGLRALDKLAVRLGGGTNHRTGLYDMVLIKDNHIEAAGSITAAVQRVRDAGIDLAIEVEIDSLEQLDEALAAHVDRVITLPRIPDISATGVDYISVGALTHSVKALDISLDLRMGPAEHQEA